MAASKAVSNPERFAEQRQWFGTFGQSTGGSRDGQRGAQAAEGTFFTKKRRKPTELELRGEIYYMINIHPGFISFDQLLWGHFSTSYIHHRKFMSYC